MHLASIPIDQIQCSHRIRKEMGDMTEFLSSFDEFGQLQTVVVLVIPEGYKLLAGGRRLAAMTLKGFSTVNCTVLENLNDLQQRKIELAENIHRKSLNHIEEAQAIRQIHELMLSEKGGTNFSHRPNDEGWSTTATAELLNVSKKTIDNAILLANGAEMFPEVHKTKTQNEALRTVRSKRTEAIRAELTRRANEAVNPLIDQTESPIEKARRLLSECYILGDCMDRQAGLPSLPDSSMDFFDLDPPWGIDYESLGASNYKETYDDSPSTYVPRLQILLPQVYRVLKDKRWLIFWCSESMLEVTTTMLRTSGFIIPEHQPPAIWIKMGKISSNRNPEQQLTSNYERFIYARKGEAVLTKPGVNTFTFIRRSDNIHPNEKPVDLNQMLYATFALTGHRMCIPYLGSGNGLIAANSLGMPAIGWDLSEVYKGGFIERLQDFNAKEV